MDIWKVINNNIDKVAHLFVSFTLLVWLEMFLPLWLSVIVVSLLGIYKEIRDTKFDTKDLIADTLGIIMGVIYIWLSN